MGIYDKKEVSNKLTQKDIDKSRCFNKLEKDCRGPCSKFGVGKLTYGSQERCRKCVNETPSGKVHPCNPIFKKKFLEEKNKKLRSGTKISSLRKKLSRKKPEPELKLDYSGSEDYGGVKFEEPVSHPESPPKSEKQKKEETEKVEEIMRIKDINRALEKGYHTPEEVKKANRFNKSPQDFASLHSNIDYFPEHTSGSKTPFSGGSRKKRKKTKRRRKSKKSRRTRRQRR